MKTAIYIRVSTKKQRTHLKNQLTALLEYCKAKKHEVIDIYQEVRSRDLIQDQDQIMALLDNAAKYNLVLITERDRVGAGDFVSFVEIALQFNNVKLIAINQEAKEDPLSKFMSGILNHVALYMMSLRRIRTKRGWNRIIFEEGRVFHRAPYGYKVHKKHLKIKQSEAKVIIKLFDLRANKYRIRMKDILSHVLIKKSGLDRRRVYYILSNPIYCGYLRKNGILIKGSHPSIITLQQFLEVNPDFHSKIHKYNDKSD